MDRTSPVNSEAGHGLHGEVWFPARIAIHLCLIQIGHVVHPASTHGAEVKNRLLMSWQISLYLLVNAEISLKNTKIERV